MRLFSRRKPKETFVLHEVSPTQTTMQFLSEAGGGRSHVLPFSIDQIEQILLDAAQPPNAAVPEAESTIYTPPTPMEQARQEYAAHLIEANYLGIDYRMKLDGFTAGWIAAGGQA